MQETESCILQLIKGSYQDNGDFDELRPTFLTVTACGACRKLLSTDTPSYNKLFLSLYTYLWLKPQQVFHCFSFLLHVLTWQNIS